MRREGPGSRGMLRGCARCVFLALVCACLAIAAQTPTPKTTAPPARKTAVAKKSAAAPAPARPTLVVMLVVDQLRADYIDKFQAQWTGGLKRLVHEGAWFRNAAYPYAATETCPGHATISTGAFPASHGMVANAWWDRDEQKMVTCTDDPNATNTAYSGRLAKGGDSAWRMKLPAFAEELKFQTGSATRVVTFSLKARAAITLAGHRADAATWWDSTTGGWTSSSQYGMLPAIESYVAQHPLTEDYGKTWSLSLPASSYLYPPEAIGAGKLDGWTSTFPHALRGKQGGSTPDGAYLEQWSTSPFADTYLTKLAEAALDSLNLGKSPGTDYLGVSYSTVDYVGHRFGPRSWEIQDILIRLDKDLGELLTHLDQKVGKDNYIVALTGDHGVAPIPADMQTTGLDAGVLNLAAVKDNIERALHPFSYPDPSVARIAGNEVYFSHGVYEKLSQDAGARVAVRDALEKMPGVAAVYWAGELIDARKSLSSTRTAAELSYFAGRSGDLYVLQQPYWLTESSAEGSKRTTGTGHGTPYCYDQRVPILLMGFGIQPGQYFDQATPADIAATLAALTGITLASHDGQVLHAAVK